MMSSSEPTLADLLKSLWDARLAMAIGGGITLIIAVIYILFATPRYGAEMIVAPADGYALGDYASSASLDRSISLPFWRPMEAEGVSTDFYRFIYTMNKPAAASILMKDKKVAEGVQADSWRLSHVPAERWNPAMLAEYFAKKINVEPLGTTPLRRLSYTHPDPEFAADMLRKMHLVADQMIRRDRRRQSQSRVNYLQDVLAKTRHPDHRKGITDLLMQQEHVLMLANLDEPYAAIIVEPASSSPRPVWPRRVIIIPAALIIGMMAGYAVSTCLRRRQIV